MAEIESLLLSHNYSLTPSCLKLEIHNNSNFLNTGKKNCLYIETNPDIFGIIIVDVTYYFPSAKAPSANTTCAKTSMHIHNQI